MERIENPDEIENFLKDFIKLSLEIDENNEIIYVNDDQDFEEKLGTFEKCDAVGIHVNESFARLYITTEASKTYVVRLNKVSVNLINSFISKEVPIKYALNSFSFVKWCNQKNIDLRNIYDIPTYIKLLTNDVDPFMDVSEYIKKYSTKELKLDDNEYNEMIIGNFILKFGKYLDAYAKKFDLDSVCKSINENSYFEGNMLQEVENASVISFAYADLNVHIEKLISQKKAEFESQVYMKSPLRANRAKIWTK